MKKLFFALFASLLCCGVAQAQKIQFEGSFYALKSVNVVDFKVDYSSASIMNMTEEDFAAYEEDWYKDKPVIISEFAHEVEDETDGRIILGTFPKAEYTIRWEVLSINIKGDTRSNIYLENREGEVLASLKGLYAKGGVFGTKLALIKDGADESGEVFAKYLNNLLF